MGISTSFRKRQRADGSQVALGDPGPEGNQKYNDTLSFIAAQVGDTLASKVPVRSMLYGVAVQVTGAEHGDTVALEVVALGMPGVPDGAVLADFGALAAPRPPAPGGTGYRASLFAMALQIPPYTQFRVRYHAVSAAPREVAFDFNLLE